MEQFYLENSALYEKLLSRHDATKSQPHFSRQNAPIRTATSITEQGNPDMIATARVRPMLDDDLAAGFPCAIHPQTNQAGVTQAVDLHDLYNHPRGRPTLKSSQHRLDRIFPSSVTTEEIYEDLVSGLVAFAQQGGIGTLFAYGQTGSGKTYTIGQLQEMAVMSLVDDEMEIYITIADLAGKSAFDLLASRKPVSVLEDSSGEIRLAGITEHQVSDKDEIRALLEQAASFRRTAPTLRNDCSSRSHSICRIRIRNNGTMNGGDGMLYLVDLAGSEAARDVATHGPDRMRETREINMSLSVLKDCVRGKCDQDALNRRSREQHKKLHLPIRQSLLTKVLKHVFDPKADTRCKTVVIACVNPSLADVGPSKNTLRYAEMLRGSMS